MATTPTEATGQNVRAEMARRRVSQTQLASHLDMSQTAISARLRGVTPFDINELARIAGYLEVPLDTLLPRPEIVAANAS